MKTINGKSLIRHALTAMKQSYAPYSRFRVGAAVLTGDGTVFTGCNVENASYGLTTCAERVAIQTAVACGCRTIQALAVVASGNSSPTPCGACRQVLAEFATPETPVFMASVQQPRVISTSTLGNLLPLQFDLPTTRKE